MPQMNRSRPSTASHRPSANNSTLSPPTYESPACPLNDGAQRALQNLQTQHDLRSLKNHLRHVNVTLSRIAADINDLYHERWRTEQRRKQRRIERGLEDDEEEQGLVEASEIFRQKIEEQTARMEESLRGSIDAQTRAEAREAALIEIHRNLAAGGGTVAPTQSTLGASQFRKTQKRARRIDMDGDGEADDSGEETQEHEVVGPVDLLKMKMEEHDARYQALSLRTRYATHNSYIEFKQLVHDARNPGDDAAPLPHPSTWFPSESQDSKPPNSTAPPGAFPTNDLDEESELQVTSERIALKCPITQALMQNPVTSTKCPHSFEKEAILQMLQQSHLTTSGEPWRRGMPRALGCPVCGVMLTADDLHTNAILVRKIKRLQAAESQGFGYDDLDGSLLQRTPGRRGNIGVEVGSDDDTGIGRERLAVKVKSSPKSPAGRGRRGVVEDEDEEEDDEEMVDAEDYEDEMPPPSSRGLVVDLGESDEEDEEDY